jgi:hypothetical protein
MSHTSWADATRERSARGGPKGPASAAGRRQSGGHEENAHLCGQVVFIDGGSDVVIRGDSTF